MASDALVSFELCPCCAYPYEGGFPNYEICPCCGFQKAVDDFYEPVSLISQRWILHGMRWWSEARTPPSNWDPEAQQLPWLIDRYSEDWQK